MEMIRMCKSCSMSFLDAANPGRKRTILILAMLTILKERRVSEPDHCEARVWAR